MCLPTTRKGTVRLVPGRGVKINYTYYWTPEFRDPAHVGKDLDVRYDPENMALALVWLNGHWAPCRSELAADFEGRTEKEVETATQEIRARFARTRERKIVTAELIARYLRKTATTEKALEAARDAGHPIDAVGQTTVPALPDKSQAEPDAESMWDNITLKLFGDFE
jgi:hypothetical protein